MPAPQLPKIALALLIAVACTAGDRGNDTTASRRNADTSRVTTHDEDVALTRDVKDVGARDGCLRGFDLPVHGR